MALAKSLDRNKAAALKLSGIANTTTDFNLYLDTGGDLVLYALGKHEWSPQEKHLLLQNGQFVLLYAQEDAPIVQDYLATHPARPDNGAFIADGIAEFLKTRYGYPLERDHFSIYKGLALALSQFLSHQPQLYGILDALVRHDSYTFYHSTRVAAYAVAISLALDPHAEARLWDLALASILHDVGYLTIEAGLFRKTGALGEKEWEQMRHHPEESLRLLEGLSLSSKMKEIILHHHERWDGGGYPHRLKSQQLPLEVRIVSVAEVYAALTVPRPYQDARDPMVALKFIESSLINFLDPKVVAALRTFV